MKDNLGLYYHPFPQDKRIRVYVREGDGTIWFRLWNKDEPELWKEHGWVPYGVIKKAMGMYGGVDFEPDRVYDLDLAKGLLQLER